MSSKAALLTLCCTLATASVARADANKPIALDKWSRYHVNITPYMPVMSPPRGKKVKWVPKVQLVFKVKSPEDDDAILLQHYRGRAKWGPVQKCSFTTAQVTKRRGPRGQPLGYSFVRPICLMNVKHAISRTGKFSVVVSYKQTGAGKLHKNLARYSYVVKRYNSNWLGRGGPVRAFYIDHDFRMGEAWLYRRTDGRLQLWSWFKYDRPGFSAVQGARLRCYVGGKKLAFMRNPTRRTEISYEHYANKRKHRKTTWGLWYWYLPRAGGVTGYQWLLKHPGKYRCTLTQKGEIARELFFEVTAKGIKRAPCQTKGGARQVRAITDSYLIKTVFKKNADLKFNRRAYLRSPFYGRKWARGCPPR